jgi:hypothetical protein
MTIPTIINNNETNNNFEFKIIAAVVNPVTQPIYTQKEFMMRPPGEEYSGFEKLLLPFDFATWFSSFLRVSLLF